MNRKTRKLIWSAPLVAVLAVAGALALFVALAPGSAQADHEALLGSVTDLNADVLGRAEIELSWKNPTGTVDSYRIDTSDDTYVWESKAMSTTNVTTDTDGTVSYTDTDELAKSMLRYYRVFAINSAGTGLAPLEDYVRAEGIDPAAPGTTQDLMARADSSTQITLTWSTPEDDGHTDITLYCISVSTPGTGFDVIKNGNCAVGDAVTTATTSPSITTINSNLVLVTPVPGTIVVAADGDTARQSYEHMGLAASTAYRYRVVAVNAERPAEVASNIASATTHAPPRGTTTTATDAVRNLRAVRVGTTVTLYWNLPADKDPNAEGFDDLTYVVATATSRSLPAASSVLWIPAAGGSPVTDPTVQGEYVVGSVSNPVLDGDATTTGLKIHYRVKVNPNGSWSTFTLDDNVFDPLFKVPGPPATRDPNSNINDMMPPLASAGGSLTQIILTWDFVANNAVVANQTTSRPTGYQVDYVMGDSDPDTDTPKQYYRSVLPEVRTGYGRSPLRHEPLEAGTEYQYRIFSYKAGVYGHPIEVTGMTAPAVAPDTRLSLRVSPEGPTKLKLTWNEPRTTGGSPITGYFIQVSNDVDDNRTHEGTDWVSIDDLAPSTEPDDGTQTAWKIDDPDTREYIYQGLMPADARWFRVIALNAVATVDVIMTPDTLDEEATDAIGSAVPVRGQTGRASLPTAPNGLVAEEARNSSLTGTSNRGVLLLWNAPEDPTGDALEGYVIARKVDDGAWDEEWQKVGESDPRTYLTDNEVPGANEVRYYRVAAFNGTGTGAWTAEVRYPTDTSHIVPPPLMPPTITSATPGTGTVMVEWTSGANAIGHLVFLFQSDFSGTPMVGTPSGKSHMFSAVPAGSYIAVVVSYRSAMDYKYDPSGIVTVQ